MEESFAERIGFITGTPLRRQIFVQGNLRSVSLNKGLKQIYRLSSYTKSLILTQEVWLDNLGSWPFMVRGFSTGYSWTRDSWPLNGFQHSNSGHIFGPLVPWEGRDFGSECRWRSKFSSLLMLWLHDLWFWSVITEKQLSILWETE